MKHKCTNVPTIFPKAFTILFNTYRKVGKVYGLLDKEAFCIPLYSRIPQQLVKCFLIPILSFRIFPPSVDPFMPGQFIWGGSGKRVVPRLPDVV